MSRTTIIIPCYNAAKTVQNAIRCAQNQVGEDVEILVVDNESTDDSVAKIEETGLTPLSTPNIHAHSWEEPVLKGLEHMTGDFWTILAADDVIGSGYISKNVAALRGWADKKSIIGIQSHITPVNQMGQAGYCIGHYYKSLAEFKKLCMVRCPVNTPSVFFKREAAQWYIPYAEKYLGAHDFFVYMHMAHYGKMIFPMPYDFGYNYNIHEGQATHKMHREPRNIDREIQDYWREVWEA